MKASRKINRPHLPQRAEQTDNNGSIDLRKSDIGGSFMKKTLHFKRFDIDVDKDRADLISIFCNPSLHSHLDEDEFSRSLKANQPWTLYEFGGTFNEWLKFCSGPAAFAGTAFYKFVFSRNKGLYQ